MIAGRYSLDREIGRGGMGAVWLGRDKVLGRQVALKRIGMLPGADSTDLARAEREARLAARLNHPHVVAIFDLVTDVETDTLWLVMEYVEGRTLAQLVAEEGRSRPTRRRRCCGRRPMRSPLPTPRASSHRDVKPSNILIDGPEAGEAGRLRHRPDRRGRLADADRAADRFAGVPGPGARHRGQGRRGRRRVVAGGDDVPRPVRQAAVRHQRERDRAGSTASSTRSRRVCTGPAG